MQIEHKKNTAYYLVFPMVDAATPAAFKTGVTPSDVGYYKDGAGAWASLAITDTATEIGTSGIYEIDLTAAEMNHDQVLIKFTIAGTSGLAADTAFLLDMRTELAEDLGNGSGQVSLLTATQASIDAVETDTNSLNDTKIPQTLNLTALGNIGIDWANVENPTSVVDLAATDIQLCDTITTYTGNTKQTADHTANISAILTDTGTTLDTKLNDIQGATFSSATDSLESIRDRGDAAWVTGAGGDATAANQTTIISHLTDVKGATWTSTDTLENIRNDTDELQVDWTNGGRLDLIIDAILVDTNSLNDTKIPQTLNLTASGNIGIDWANVENPTTALDLAGTDIQLCDTITTYTGNTKQTGDNYARIGAPAGASVSADVAAIKAETALIVADTNELQTDWTNGGRLDLLLDAAVWDLAGVEPSSVPAHTAALKDKLNFIFAVNINKITETSAVFTLRNAADAASIGTASVADDGTTTTRGAMS